MRFSKHERHGAAAPDPRGRPVTPAVNWIAWTLFIASTACLPNTPDYSDNFFLMTTTPYGAYGEPYCDTERTYNRVLFVNNGVIGGDGNSWSSAYGDLQDAITASSSGTEIWVAAGVYYPSSTGDTSANFTLVDGTGIHGGFKGDERLCSARNVSANVTVLSGDIDNNDTTDANGITTTTAGITGTNSLRITRIKSDTTGVLSGLTITATDSTTSSRSGLRVDGDGAARIWSMSFFGNNSTNNGPAIRLGNTASATITDSRFSGNTATTNGGAVYLNPNATVTVSNSTFSGNSAATDGGAIGTNTDVSLIIADSTFSGNSATGNGGAIDSNAGTTVTVTNSTFSGNTATSNGGALRGDSGTTIISDSTFTGNTGTVGQGAVGGTADTTIDSCVFIGNSTSNNGGAIGGTNTTTVSNSFFINNTAGNLGGAFSISGGTYDLINLVLSGNTSTSHGGAINIGGGLSNVEVVNSTIYGNTSGNQGGGIRITGTGTHAVYNTIISGNSAPTNTGIQTGTGTLTVSHSLVQNCTAFTECSGDTTNTDAAPTFVDTSNITGADGAYGTSDDGLSLVAGSRGINEGNDALFTSLTTSTTDITGGGRFNGTIDMGAYER